MMRGDIFMAHFGHHLNTTTYMSIVVMVAHLVRKAESSPTGLLNITLSSLDSNSHHSHQIPNQLEHVWGVVE